MSSAPPVSPVPCSCPFWPQTASASPQAACLFLPLRCCQAFRSAWSTLPAPPCSRTFACLPGVAQVAAASADTGPSSGLLQCFLSATQLRCLLTEDKTFHLPHIPPHPHTHYHPETTPKRGASQTSLRSRVNEGFTKTQGQGLRTQDKIWASGLSPQSPGDAETQL